MKLESNVKKTLKKIGLSKREKIVVALSGGKDSTVTAYLLKKFGYNVEAIHIYLGMKKYSDDCLNVVKEICKKLDINLHVYYVKKEIGKSMLEIFKKNTKKKLSSCTMCGVMKKWLINKKARQLKADKIITGHHKDDELQTFFMNILKGSVNLSSNFGPILKTKDKKFVVKVKPLFFVSEDEIENYFKKLKLPSVKEVCPYRKETYRVKVRKFFKKLSEKEKENMMKNFLKASKKIQIDRSEMRYCESCGEPSRNEFCKKCELMK